MRKLPFALAVCLATAAVLFFLARLSLPTIPGGKGLAVLPSPMPTEARKLINVAALMYGEPAKPIFDADGKNVGEFDYTICTPQHGIIGVNFGGATGQQFYIDQIWDFHWPVAFLDKIDVWPRKQGHGTRGLELFYAAARADGAELAMLRVGWNNAEDEKWNEEWYLRRGWVRLHDDPTWKGAVPIMYRTL